MLQFISAHATLRAHSIAVFSAAPLLQLLQQLQHLALLQLNFSRLQLRNKSDDADETTRMCGGSHHLEIATRGRW